MNPQVTMIGAFIAFIIILPFVLMNIGKKKKKNKLLQALNNLAQKENCAISQFEIWGNNSIGIDENAGVLFFNCINKESDESQIIKLAEVQKCTIINRGRSSDPKQGSYNAIDHLYLSIIFIDLKKESSIEFYNVDKHMQLTDELILIEKWHKIINSNLKKSK